MQQCSARKEVQYCYGIADDGSGTAETSKIYLMSITYKGVEYTNEQITEARDFINQCDFPDLERDLDGNYDLTDIEVIAGVARHYEGGLSAFINDLFN